MPSGVSLEDLLVPSGVSLEDFLFCLLTLERTCWFAF
jgi:hypothetical protein